MASSLAAIAAAICDLTSSPWLEEILIILSIGITFALTQTTGVAPKRPPARAGKLAQKEKEEAEEAEGPPCNPRRVQTRAAQRVGGFQWTSPEMPGVTDRRFVGHIRMYREDEGFGFIRCPETWERLRRDVFMHRTDAGVLNVRVGARVSFGIFINRNGHAQAKDLEVCPLPPLPNFEPGVCLDASASKNDQPQAKDPEEPSSHAADSPAWAGWNPRAAPFVPSTEDEKRRALNPWAQPFQLQAGVVPEAADPYHSPAAEREATWQWWPPLWKEQRDSKQHQAPCVQGDQEEKSFQRRWGTKESDASKHHQAPCGQSEQDEKQGEKRWAPKEWEDSKQYQAPHQRVGQVVTFRTESWHRPPLYGGEAKGGEEWWGPEEWGDSKRGEKPWVPKAEVKDPAAPWGQSDRDTQKGEKRWVPKERDDDEQYRPSYGLSEKRWVPKERDDDEQCRPSYGQSEKEAKGGEKWWGPKEWDDSKSGEKRWVPKAETSGQAAGSHDAWQWVPKRVVASEAQWVPKRAVASGAGSHGELTWVPKKVVTGAAGPYNKVPQWAPKRVVAGGSAAEQ